MVTVVNTLTTLLYTVPEMGGRSKDIEKDIRIAIMLGAEWTVGEIARHLGVQSQAVSIRMSRDKTGVIDRFKAFTKIAISKRVEERLRKAEDELEEQRHKLRTKGYKLLKKKIDVGLSDEVPDPDQTHLNAAEFAIERVEGKALDRKSIEERRVQYNVEVDSNDLMSVLQDAAQINELRRAALPPAPTSDSAIEAELVDEST